MMQRFTPGDDRLDFDESFGAAAGPRAIDRKAGLVRFRNPADDRALTDFRAVAVVFSERAVRKPSTRSHAFDPSQNLVPKMVHSVVLVPHRLHPQTAAMIGALESRGPLPPGFSVLLAAAELAQDSLLLGLAGPGEARALAKAIARLADWPMVELYGEFPVWRARDRLDLTLQDWRAFAPAFQDAGPAPASLQVMRAGGAVSVRFAAPPRPMPPWLLIVVGVVALLGAAGAFFADKQAAIALVVIGGFILVAGIIGLREPRRSSHGLTVGPDKVCWEGENGSGELATASVEMLRVAESFLVIVGHSDELRCKLPDPQAAHWVRAAVMQHLLPSA
jgi:hypothetical protein